MININKIIEKIEENVIDDINELGFDIEYIEYVKELDSYILRVVVDKLNGESINIEEIENISRKIEDKVDNLMNNNEYIFEVSSPGLERQLKNIKLYKKYIGKDIFVKLYKQTNILDDIKLKEFECKLIDVVDNNIVINLCINDINIKTSICIDDIGKAYTVYDFKGE
ncbi:MAG: ribosome maturation factor RimP [Clostridia bacterium]